jgi:hypothetical protein
MRFRFLTAAFAACSFSLSAHAAIVEEFKAEDWDGTAFTDDSTGQFSHCAVYASYRNGSTLYISYEVAESWYLSVSNDSWQLTEGESYDVKFKIDRRGEIEGTGGALAANQIGLPVEADHQFIGQLRRGNQLTITFQGQDYAFELSNSNRAMNAAQDCVRRHVAAGTRTPVMSRKPLEETTSGEPEQAPATEDSTSTSGDNVAVSSGQDQTFGAWVVSPTEDSSGNFVNCTAYGMHGDDQLILSYFSDGVWTFGLYRAAWNLDTNQTHYLWYNVDAPADAQGVIKRPVDASEPTRVFFEISDLEDIIERMETGQTLNIQVRALTGDPENFSYPLDQTREAFAAARQCVADHASSETISKDGGTKGNEPTAEEETTRSGESSEPQPLPDLATNALETFDAPGWKVAGFGFDNDTFTHCAIEAEYQNGATFGVALTPKSDLLLFVKHGDWSLVAESWVPITYTLGADAPSSSGQAQAVDANALVSRIGNYADVGATLRNARQVGVSAEGKDFSFDTSDIGPALDEIEWCMDVMITGGPQDPPAARKEEAPTPAPDGEQPSTDAAPVDDSESPNQMTSLGKDAASSEAPVVTMDIRTEAAGFTTALLLRSGHPNHVILGADAAVPDGVPPGDAAWQLEDVVGSTRIVSASTTDDAEREFATTMITQCDGAFSDESVASDATHAHYRATCEGTTRRTTQVVVVPRDAGGSYIFAMNGAGDDIAEELIATALYATGGGS